MKKKVAFAYALAVFLIAVQVSLLVMAMSECGLAWKITLGICCLPVVGSIYPIYFADAEDKTMAVSGFSCLTGGIVWTLLGIQLLSLTLLGYSIDATPFKLISVYMLIWFGLFSLLSVINTKSKVSKMEIATYSLFLLSIAAILVSTVVEFAALLKTAVILCLLASIIGIIFFLVMRFMNWLITRIHIFFSTKMNN